MKIKFTKLPTTDGTIKVSLDGGQSFTDYSVADVHESGILLADSQDYEKIQIQAPANILRNLDVVSSVKVDDGSGSSEVDLSDYVQKEYFRGELYDGGCGTGFRLTDWPRTTSVNGDFSILNLLDSLYLSDGTSLGRLCNYDGHYDTYSSDSKPTGQLYVWSDYVGCPPDRIMIPTQYYLV